MWGWFRAEDPVAEAWVDSYNQGLEVGGGQYGSYQQKEHYNNYDHSISGSQPEQYFEGAHANPRPSHHYPRPAEPLPPHRYQEGSSRYPHNAAPHKRRQGNRRVSENGYEYVNLDEINRIGDASVRLFAQIVQGMDENHQHPEDFYRYPDEDNTIARRRLSAPRPHPNPYPAQTHPYQYPEEPSYQAYPQEQYQEESYKFPYQSEGNSEGYSPEEHHWYTGQGNDASFKDTKEDSYKDVPHPYRKEGEEVYLTDFAQVEAVNSQPASLPVSLSHPVSQPSMQLRFLTFLTSFIKGIKLFGSFLRVF
ncbi:uncharacterized protein LOC135094587 isoform X1 [Scylla paramamosain]|uniref:uncharacterized protein LOC135094587 isoform X1 n=1 Tax=Scylla paramamosain TaxID=85552 RepID=UPI00308351DD